MRWNATQDDVTAAVGDAIRSGKVKADLGHSTIGAYAAWMFAEERALEVSIGGSVEGSAPSELYPLAGTPEELRAFGEVLRSAGIAPPWNCPDCAVAVGERHEDGCDVGCCPECGRQALGCDEHLDSGTQVWTGRRPGGLEVEEGLANDLNDLVVKAARGEVVWDRTTERYVRPN